jgi:hypothetical protein
VPGAATALASVHAVPTAPDPYHQRYGVDPAIGRAVLPACRVPGRVYERRPCRPRAQQFADGCASETNTAAPTMQTPAEGRLSR